MTDAPAQPVRELDTVPDVARCDAAVDGEWYRVDADLAVLAANAVADQAFDMQDDAVRAMIRVQHLDVRHEMLRRRLNGKHTLDPRWDVV